MNLENLNVQELSVQEQIEIDGGIIPLAVAIGVGLYLGSAFIQQNMLR